MIIKNGTVFTENFRFEKKDLLIEKGRIVPCEQDVSDPTIVDASGLLVLPGFVDIHTHGSCGKDFCDADGAGLVQIARFQRQNGITSFCPTSMTLPEEALEAIFKTATQAKDPSMARIVGINMEGPFIAKEKKGAQNGAYIIPASYELFHRLNEGCGNLIKLVTLAPETENALSFIQQAAREVNISIGHTNADYATACQAFAAGANHVTHLYNAMPPFSHRAPGVIGAAQDCADCMVELISDGIHIHPSVVRATFRLFGADRVVLISDSMMACGMPDGVYELGRQDVYMQNGTATLADGTLAGSTATLYECVKRAISFGVPAEQAIQAATANPAKSIGCYDEIGSLAPGKRADVLLVTKDFELKQVISGD